MSASQALRAGVRPLMTSYAGHAEDVVLRRLFAPEHSGFYVDVGAGHPFDSSVTRHFYDRGWKGVNVQGDVRCHDALVAARERDVNLLDVPASGARTGQLGELLRRYGPPDGVDFLRLADADTAGQLLASTDWQHARPAVVLVAAVDHAGVAQHHTWEQALVGAGYRFGLFDGLNRFYCREQDAERLLPAMSAPANPLDGWRPAGEVRLREQLTDCRARASALEQSLQVARQAHAHAHSAFLAEHDEHARTVAILQHQQASTSWRITAPLRVASALRGLLRRRTAP